MQSKFDEKMGSIDWVDPPEFTPERVVLTGNEIGISEIRTFGYHSTTKAIPPLASHFHRDAIEMTYVEHGSIDYFIGSSKYRTQRGNMLFVPGNTPHSTNGIPMGLHVQYWFQLETKTNPDSFLLLSPSKSRELVYLLENRKGGMTALDTGFASPYLKNIYTQFCSSSQKTRDVGVLKLACFLFEVLENGHAGSVSGRKENRLLAKLISHLVKFPEEDYDMEVLAQSVNMSVSSFKSQFARQTGYPPREYINIQKTEKAKRLLMENTPITQIAMDLNFTSSSYFSTMFKRITGYTPSEYQESALRHRRTIPEKGGR